jgi:hypothetical protein
MAMTMAMHWGVSLDVVGPLSFIAAAAALAIVLWLRRRA